MSEQHAYGIKTFKMGAIGTGGIMGTSLSALPDTVKGSVKFGISEGSVKTYEANGKPRPVLAIASGGSIETIEASFYDVTPATMMGFFGGSTVAAVPGTSGAIYKAGATIPQIEKSFEIETANGITLSVVRGLLVGSLEASLNDDGTWTTKVKITVLEPTDGTSPAYQIEMPTPAA